MTAAPKIYATILNDTSDRNISFSDLQKLLDYLGFQHRTKGSHFIYWHENIEEIINIQSDGNNAKALLSIA